MARKTPTERALDARLQLLRAQLAMLRAAVDELDGSPRSSDLLGKVEQSHTSLGSALGSYREAIA